MDNQIIAAILDRLPASGRRVVFVCGLGGVGKTEFCRQAAALCNSPAAYIQADWYLADASHTRHHKIAQIFAAHQENDPNGYGNPQNWYDLEVFTDDLAKLQTTGNLSVAGAWNQLSGEKDLDVTVQAETNAIIWCDGIYLLHAPIKDAADAIVLLEASNQDVRLRTQKRDQHRSPKSYLVQKDTLMHIFDVPYFERYQGAADIVIDNSDYTKPITR